MRHFFNQFIPFIIAGIVIVAFTFGIMLLAYLFLFGAIIGFTLFVISWIRAKFFPSTLPQKTKQGANGRIIDTDEWKKL